MISQDLQQAQVNADEIAQAMLQLLDYIKQHSEVDRLKLAQARHVFLQSITLLRAVLGNSRMYRA